MAASVKKLTHFDARGAVHMVDVGEKPVTHRIAMASGRITMQAATLKTIEGGTAKKGDVLAVARLAAIQAAKRTADLIPLAHPLALSRVAVEFALERRPAAVRIAVRVECRGPTGVGRPADDLRYGEGHRSRHDARRRAAGGKKRRPLRGIPPHRQLE